MPSLTKVYLFGLNKEFLLPSECKGPCCDIIIFSLHNFTLEINVENGYKFSP